MKSTVGFLTKYTLQFSVIAFWAIVVSCSVPASENQEKVYFFDTRSYFDRWVKEYSNSTLKVKKTITEAGAIEEEKDLFLKEINWKKELALFYESGINKAALKDQYRTDTLRNDSIRLVRFAALDSALSVRQLDLLYAGNDEHPAYASHMRTSNLLYESQIYLYFHPFHRYSIHMKQEIKHSGISREYHIKGLIY